MALEGAQAQLAQQALIHLAQAQQGSSIYGFDHPAVEAEIARAVEHLNKLSSSARSLCIGVTSKSILVDGTELTNVLIAEFGRLLHARNIAACTLRQGVTAEDIRGFLQLLCTVHRDIEDSRAQYADISERTAGRIEISALRFSSLRFQEGAATRRGADDAQRWSTLIESILSPSDIETHQDMRQMAHDLNATVADPSDHHGAELVQHLQDLTAQMNELPLSQREEVAQRLHTFVNELSPQLRASLMRIDAVDPDASISLVSELAETMSISEVLTALGEVDRLAASVSPETVRLCKKFAVIAEGSQQGQAALRGVIDSMRARVPDGPDPGGLRESLTELLHSQSWSDAFPQAYQDHLNELSETHERASSVVVSRDFAAEFDGRLRAVQVALDLVGDPHSSATDCSGAFHRLDESIVNLIELRRFDLLRTACRCARVRQRDDGDGETRAAAAAMLSHAWSAASLTNIIRNGATAAGFDPEARELLKSSSCAGLKAVLHFLASGPRRERAELAIELLAHFSEETYRQLTHELAGQRFKGIDQLLPTFEYIPRRFAAPMLTSLMQCVIMHPRRNNARVGRDLAARLEMHRDDKDAKKALRRWRFSAARCLGMLEGRFGRVGEAA